MGEALNGRMFVWQQSDRTGNCAFRDRSARGEEVRDLLHERLARAILLVASPDPLPPHGPHLARVWHVMEHPSAAATTDRDNPVYRAPGRRSRARDHHEQQLRATLDVLDMDAFEAEQQTAAGTRISSRARGSTPRSRVKHAEALGVEQQLAPLILGNLTPTRQPSPGAPHPHRMPEEPYKD